MIGVHQVKACKVACPTTTAAVKPADSTESLDLSPKMGIVHKSQMIYHNQSNTVKRGSNDQVRI
jgi:hypothetical protein